MSNWPEGWTRDDRRVPAGGAAGSAGGDEATQVLGRPDSRAQGAPSAPARPAGPGTPPPPPPPSARTSRGRRWTRGQVVRRVLLAILLVFALLLGLVMFFFSRVEKIDAVEDYGGRPAATPGQDWLLVGSDSREGLSDKEVRQLHLGKVGGRRTDTIMLLHIPSGGGKPTLVSLPRDSYVPIPGHGRNKLNAAYAFGGPKLLVRTVDQVTGIRIDHYAEIGFGGFVGMTDAVGGVELCPKRRIKDHNSGLNVRKGCQEMDGRTALAYVRARYFDPKGDLGRVQRQQEFLGAVFDEATQPTTLLNPFAITRLGNAGTQSLRVDEDDGPIDLLRFALAMRKVAGGDGRKVTVPVSDPNLATPAGSAVKWDTDRALRLFQRLQER
jgi:LCP family protein required for cell wall assembly